MTIDEISAGIYRLKIPLPHKDLFLGYVNIYLIKGNEGYILVDTGWGTEEAYNSLQQQLNEIRVRLDEIKLVFSTHIHPDHYGLSGKIKEVSGARVAIHRADAAMVGDRYISIDSLMKSLSNWLHINGVPDTSLAKLQTASLGAIESVKPAAPDWLLDGGELVRWGEFNLKILHTPGHSQGHICLYEAARKVLLSGDHVLPAITSHIGLHPQSAKNPLGDFLNSLDILKRLDIELVLPGHENPFSGLDTRIAQLRQHHNERFADILDKIKGTARTAYDIATGMIWLSDTSGISFDRLSFWDQRLAILEALSHLECLKFEGRVTRSSRNGLVYYQSV